MININFFKMVAFPLYINQLNREQNLQFTTSPCLFFVSPRSVDGIDVISFSITKCSFQSIKAKIFRTQNSTGAYLQSMQKSTSQFNHGEEKRFRQVT